MFMPKGRQLSAMGKEGVYAEDRTDVYTGTGSSTQSTASGSDSTHEGGTPSPSFFPIQPHNAKEAMASRERISTPQSPKKHRNLTPNSTCKSTDIYYSRLLLKQSTSIMYLCTNHLGWYAELLQKISTNFRTIFVSKCKILAQQSTEKPL